MNLQLSDQQVDTICRALAEIPWKIADPIMKTIIDQANDATLNPRPDPVLTESTKDNIK